MSAIGPGGSRYQLYSKAEPASASGWTLETLIGPTRLFNSNGIQWGPDGRLWIAEFNGEQVSAWDPRQDLLSLCSPMGAPLRGPDDVAFDSTGAFWVTETMNSRVTGRRADGEYVVLLDDVPGANGITVDPRTDILYVDEMRIGGRVLQVDRDRPGKYDVLADELQWCNAMEVSPAGQLCLPQVFDGVVLAVNLDDRKVSALAGDFNIPTAVKFDSRGRLVVSEAGTGNITAVDLATGKRETLASPGPGIDNFCFDPAGNLYTSNYCESKVEQFSGGARRGVLSPGGLIGPYQVAVDQTGRFFAADANSLVELIADGSLRRHTRLLIDQAFVMVGVAFAGSTAVLLSGAGDVFIRKAQRDFERIVEATADATAQYLSTERAGATAVGPADGNQVIVALTDGRSILVAESGEQNESEKLRLDVVSSISQRGGVTAACDADARTVSIVSESHGSARLPMDRPGAAAVGDDGVFVLELGSRQLRWVSFDGGSSQIVCADLPLGMPVDGFEHTRRCSLAYIGRGRVLIGCDGDGSVRIAARAWAAD